MKKIILLGCLLLSWGFSFSQVRKVTQAEYFWNTDPGLGNATPLQAADGQFDQAIEELFATSTTVLNHGPNKFGIRVKDAQGVWGNTFFTVLQVDSVSNSVPALLANRRVTQAEYFWNTDPGNGNGIPLLALDGNLDQSIEELFATSTTVLNYGPNKFGIRVKDNDGVWSRTFLTLVQVDSVDNTVPALLTNRRVTQAEYFWNTDPGNGNGIPLLALDGNLDQSIEELFATSTTVLNYGPNKFGIRVKDNDGVWSRTFLTLVQVDSVDNTLPTLLTNRRVTQAEYFWNTDPGNGNCIPLLALDGNLDQSIEELFATSTTVLNYGPNKFGIRVKDNDGVWSRTFLTLVQVDSVDNTLPTLLTNRRVTQAEYFWNTDPGNGNCIPLLALDGNLDQSIEELFATSTTVLNYGPNKFGIRVKDNDGVWSRTFLTLVQVDSVDNSIPSLLANRKVTRGEYFWDADPGVGQGIPLLFVDGAGDQSVEELQAIDPANLSNGVHRIGLRVFDSNHIAGNTFFTIMVVEGDSTNDFNVYTNTHTVRQCRGAVAQLQAFGARMYRWFPAAGLSTDTGARVNASPDTTTRYLVVGTDSLGRTDSAYVWVKVINEVQVVSVGSTSLCQGQSLVLKARADSSASFQWLKNSVTISGAVDSSLLVVTAGSYQVIASVDGCVDTSIGLTVVVDTPQNLVLQLGNSQICNTGGTWATVVGNNNRRPVQWKRNGVILSNISDSLWIGDGANYRVSVVTPCLDWKDSFQLNVIAVDTGKVQQKICAGQTVTFNGSTLNRSGIYYDTLSSVLGCDSLVELTLMVDTVPFAFGLDSMSACGGSTLLTTSVSGTQYLWSTGGTGNSITVSQSGWYSCTITRDQCSTNDSIYVDLLEVNAGDDTAICAGSSITLGATVNGSAAAASLPANLRQGLIGYWPFNGNANDESGNGNNGTVNGATLAADRFGNTGKAYWFDGNSNNILIGNSVFDSLYQVTISAYIKTSDVDGGYIISTGNLNEFALSINNLGQFVGETNYLPTTNGSTNFQIASNSSAGNNNNQWKFVAMVFDGQTNKLYVDRNLVDIDTAIAPMLITHEPSYLSFGSYYWWGSVYQNSAFNFSGDLDDIMIYNRALSSNEIQQLFKQGQSTYLWSTGATTPTINVNPTQTTTYYCTVSNGITTCTDSVVVTVKSNPIVSLPDTARICGTTATLNAGNGLGLSYSWNTGDTMQVISVNQSGWYRCNVFNGNCFNTDSVYVDLLDVKILNSDTSICSGTALTLSTSQNQSINSSPSIYNPGAPNPWGYPSPSDGGYIPLGTFGRPNIFSISCYINPSDTQAGIAIIMDCNHGGNLNWVIQNYPNISSGSNWSFGALQFTLATNTWQHLLITYNNGQKKAYVNGILQSTVVENINWSGNPSLFLGNWPEGARRFRGGVDELYITYDLQQTANFNPTNYVTNVSPNTFGLWHFDEAQGTTTQKSSGGGYPLNNWIWQNRNSVSNSSFLWSTGATTPTINVNPTQTTTYYCTVSNGITTCTDSVVVTVNHPSTNAISASICSGGSYAFGSRTLTAAGVYRDTLANASGCDSIVVLTLNVNAPSTNAISASICSGGSYAFGSRTLTAAGVYRDTLANASGCDSIVVLTLNVNQPTSSALSASICSGGSYFFGGVNRSVSGVYSNVLVGSNGCDSVVTLTLNVNSTIVQSLQASICEGNQYTFGNRSLTLSGIYYDTLRTSTGCDSILTLQLTVNSNPTVSIQASGVLAFCQGGSVTLSASGANNYAWSNSATSNSINITQSGNYSVVGTDTNGCVGSAAAVHITVYTPVVPSITANGATNVCNTNVTINSTSAPSYLWSNGATTASIVATASGLYSVTTTDSNGCTAVSNSIQVNKFTAVPSRPVAIAGELNPCAVLGTSNTLTYSVPADPNVLSYTWLLTNGITAVGNATGNVISVTYPAGFSTGQIRATPVNACGNGLARAIYPKKSAITTVPVFTQSVTSVCNIRGTATQATYSVQPIAGCSGYQWTMPTQATLISGQGTNSIQVIFDAAFSSGSISVIGISNCGNTPSSSITVSLLAKPVISGSNSICPGDLVTYTMPVVPGAIRYRFNLPAGLSLVSQNANSAVITNNGSFVSGSLGAQVQTTLCGWSQPGSLSLNTSACRGVVGDFSVNIYPNPSAGEFQLQLGAPVKDVQVSVYASDGRLVKRLVFGQVETQTLYFNDVAEGLYHLEVVATDSENKVHRKMEKMLIQR